MTIYLVIRLKDKKVMTVFADEDSADRFVNMLPNKCYVEERTLFYGQPPNRGFNL